MERIVRGSDGKPLIAQRHAGALTFFDPEQGSQEVTSDGGIIKIWVPEGQKAPENAQCIERRVYDEGLWYDLYAYQEII